LSDNEKDHDLKLCTEVYNRLLKGELGATPADAETYRQRCREVYDKADLFKTESENDASSKASQEQTENSMKEPEPSIQSTEMNGILNERVST
jgi:hypothetical protein